MAPKRKSLAAKPGGGRGKAKKFTDGAKRQSETKWAIAVMERAYSLVKDGTHPAKWVMDKFGIASGRESQTSLRNSIQTIIGGAMNPLEGITFPVASDKIETLSIPLDAFVLERPAIGEDLIDLPPRIQWMNTLRDICFQGYDTMREAIQVKLANPEARGRPLAIGSVVPVKGFTRISVIMFIIAVSVEFTNNLALSDDDSDPILFEDSKLFMR